jgi:uncharacterized protein
MIKCLYHNADLDGQCAGASVKHFLPQAELIGINYGDPFPWDSVQGEDVIMVDFSIQPFEGMLKLRDMCDLTWIDHHKSAIEERGNRPFAGIQREGIGACALVWEYFNSEEPYAVRLLAEYDVWNHKDPATLPFQWGIRLEDTRPENQSLWGDLFDDMINVNSIVNTGKTILRYMAQENEKYIKAAAFETELDGLKCISVNKMLTNSQLFDSIWDPEKYHAMLTFGFRNGKWTVSLYSTRKDVDVSAVAKTHGGGGHKGASGFQCDILPFELIRLS